VFLLCFNASKDDVGKSDHMIWFYCSRNDKTMHKGWFHIIYSCN